MERVRVFRLLIYEGPRGWVEYVFNSPALFVPMNGTKRLNEKAAISSRILGEWPEVIKEEEESDD